MKNAFIEIIKKDKTKYEYEIPYNRKRVDKLTYKLESILHSVYIVFQ